MRLMSSLHLPISCSKAVVALPSLEVPEGSPLLSCLNQPPQNLERVAPTFLATQASASLDHTTRLPIGASVGPPAEELQGMQADPHQAAARQIVGKAISHDQ